MTIATGRDAASQSEATSIADRVTDIVARALSLPATEIDRDRPLALHGLDSMSSMAVVASLEDAFGRDVPAWLLADCPTVAAIALFLDTADASVRAPSSLIEDARLPADVRPGPPSHASRSHVLLTGATGFLGAWLVRELGERTSATVTCLVRGEPDRAATRLRHSLVRHGQWTPSLERRLEVVAGDLASPRLGLSDADYDRLAETVDLVLHAGAEVDWVRPYGALRDVNVGGTLEAIRFASTGREKELRFVSSQLVGFVQDGPTVVTEDDEWLDLAHRLPLGYAQSKAVAEALVSGAAGRGLRTTIFRPGLIVGDARTGASNPDDFVAALIKGCIELGAAPDLDWTIDAVPVDYVARAVVHLSGGNGDESSGANRYHLSNPRKRHWRECVLWMNLYGYTCPLVPYAEWLLRLDRDSRDPGHALHRLRPFFLRRHDGGLTTPELYEDGRRARVDSRRARAAESQQGISCAALSAELIDLTLDDLVAQGFLPRPDVALSIARPEGGRPLVPRPARHAAIDDVSSHVARLGALAVRGLPGISIGDVEIAAVDGGTGHSILGELTARRSGRRTGLFRYRVRAGSAPAMDVALKLKARDSDVVEVGQTVANVCGPALGLAYAGVVDCLDVRGGHLRELAVYERAPEAARRFMPNCLGVWRDAPRDEWGLAIEWLSEATLLDAVDDPGLWTPTYLEASVDGLGALHAAWLPDAAAFASAPWMGYLHVPDSPGRLQPWWSALRAHAEPFIERWSSAAVCAMHARLVAGVDTWWAAYLSGPRTLIHNDFNPRNVALRPEAGGHRISAYDWELSTIGLPQRDLAEWLCFVLPPDVDSAVVWRLVDRHRNAFVAAGGDQTDAVAWHEGLVSALAMVLVDRLATYTMIQRVRPQAFLPRVVQTWARVFSIVDEGGHWR